MASGSDGSQERWVVGFEGTEVEYILRGFHDTAFQAVVAQFVAERAAAFAVVCPDGSHPLAWTAYHREYRDLFEGQLDAVLQANGVSHEEAQGFMTFLHTHGSSVETVAQEQHGLQQGDIDMLLRYLISSEDYAVFLGVMFAELRRQQALQLQAMQTQELSVTVPEGLGPGQALAVDYLGVRYELVVPEGYEPGMVFQAAVTLPS